MPAPAVLPITPAMIGVTGFGRLYLAITLTGIMSILVEFGLNSLVARQGDDVRAPPYKGASATLSISLLDVHAVAQRFAP